MAGEEQGAFLRGIERIFNQGSLTGLSEGQLLRRFAAGDEGAFEALVRRHGPMVLGVCRRVLGHEHDADANRDGELGANTNVHPGQLGREVSLSITWPFASCATGWHERGNERLPAPGMTSIARRRSPVTPYFGSKALPGSLTASTVANSTL